MGWKGNIVEVPIWIAGKFAPTLKAAPEHPRSIFVLRNNDLGDVLVVTPLFEALRKRFPRAHIVAGVGAWSVDTLRHNPYVDEVMIVNAPWNNKFVSGQKTRDVINYIWDSDEALAIEKQRFEIGIDILGSHVGSALMMRAKIPYRLGVRGYRGGHTATQQFVVFDENQHAGRAALRFADLLGAKNLPECRPQIFLSLAEREEGEHKWSDRKWSTGDSRLRIVVGPGAGLPEKSWPAENYAALIRLVNNHYHAEICVVGGKQDREIGHQLIDGIPAAMNFCGALDLRETFGLVAASDAVICNSSMLMHAAAAFRKQTFVMLGECFPSARLHQAGWGYPDTCWSCGKDDYRSTIFSTDEAFSLIRERLTIDTPVKVEGA